MFAEKRKKLCFFINAAVVLSESVRAGTLNYSVGVLVPGFIFQMSLKAVAAFSETWLELGLGPCYFWAGYGTIFWHDPSTTWHENFGRATA
jgi:hypothetical protein